MTRTPMGGEVTGDRQRHRDQSAVGSGVRGLAHTTFEGGDRRDVDDAAALTVAECRLECHRRGDDPDAVERRILTGPRDFASSVVLTMSSVSVTLTGAPAPSISLAASARPESSCRARSATTTRAPRSASAAPQLRRFPRLLRSGQRPIRRCHCSCVTQCPNATRHSLSGRHLGAGPAAAFHDCARYAGMM